MSGPERPQYGEYASKEEQARAIERSGVTPAQPGAESEPPRLAPLGARPAAGRSDRLATIFLLALGLVYLLGGVASYLDLPTAMTAVYAQFGIGDYHPTAQTPVIGVAIIVAQAVIWLLAAVWSYRRLRAGRITFWVPIVGAVVSFVVSVILLGTLIFGDPAFVAYLTSS